MVENWASYWHNLIENRKLENHISEMNMADELCGSDFRIEEICHKIYDDYQGHWHDQLEIVRSNFLKVLDGFKNVHLQTSRVKSIDSLLEKIIIKRYKSYRKSDNVYVKINAENYRDIVTDLVGMRIILNYRGNWKAIHEEILKYFPYDASYFTDDEIIHPHPDSEKGIIAQQPKAYYAYGDDISQYQSCGLSTKLHDMGYRSIHYTISYQHVYIELQIRTTYDEAWSDCDHNYVYKQDSNKSYSALKELSLILCELTNISNDIGDNMREIFEQQSYRDIGNGEWETSDEARAVMNITLERLQKAYTKLETFCNHTKVR